MRPRPRKGRKRFSDRWTRILTDSCHWQNLSKEQKAILPLFVFYNVILVLKDEEGRELSSCLWNYNIEFPLVNTKMDKHDPSLVSFLFFSSSIHLFIYYIYMTVYQFCLLFLERYDIFVWIYSIYWYLCIWCTIFLKRCSPFFDVQVFFFWLMYNDLARDKKKRKKRLSSLVKIYNLML